MSLIVRFSVVLPALALASLTAAVFVAPAFTATAKADVITFSGLPFGNPPVITYTEGFFTVTTLTGSVFGTPGNGAPPPSIFGRDGYSVEVTRTGGTTFTFSSVALGSGSFSSGATATVTGFLAGNQVLSQSGSAGAASFSTLASTNTSAVLDSLVISVSGATANLDNITVSPTATTPTAVPEPSEWAIMGMLGTSLCGLMVRARRNARLANR